MSERPGGWVYQTFQWREGDGDFEAWVQGIAAKGWGRSEYGAGAWSTVDQRRTFGLTVRRWSARPAAAPPP